VSLHPENPWAMALARIFITFLPTGQSKLKGLFLHYMFATNKHAKSVQKSVKIFQGIAIISCFSQGRLLQKKICNFP
jgi:hypothetical protein